jgi:hypothetical protein
MPTKSNVKTQRPTHRESREALKMQEPKKGQATTAVKNSVKKQNNPPSRKRFSLPALQGPGGEKWRMSELATDQIEFDILSVNERSTQNGDAYIFNILINGERAHFWAPVDNSRTELVNQIREFYDAPERKNGDVLGPFHISEMEPTRRGFSGYCKIVMVSTEDNDEVPF